MIIHNVEQGSIEWHLLKAGRFTASKFPILFTKKDSKGYQNLINDIAYSRVTGEIIDTYSNDAMRRGIELEPEAIENYEMETLNEVERVGFVELNSWIGCSPDGFVGKDGMVQIKCPLHNTMIEYHMTGEIPENYMIQMQGELYVCGRQWNDYYVYHPKLKSILIRVERKEPYIKEIQEELTLAIDEAESRIKIIGAK